MTKGKHTPGPWETQELRHQDGELWLQIGSHGRGPITSLTGDDTREPTFKPVAGMKYLAAAEPEVWANARLITESPAMKDLIKEAYGLLGNPEDAILNETIVLWKRETRAILARIKGKK